MPQEEKQGGTATLQDIVEEKEEEIKEPEDNTTEKEHKNEPREGSKRWNEVYYEAKEAKRRNEQLEKDLDALRKHNNEMMEVFKNNTSPDSPQNVNKELKELKAQKRELVKNQEWDKIADIEDKMDELRDKIYSNPHKKETIKEEDIEKIVEKKVLFTNEKKALEDFQENTEWFNPESPNYDEYMAATAIGLDRKLQNTFEGSLQERLREVKKKVEEKYGYKKRNKSSPPVEGVGDEGKERGKDKIDLSPEELHVARSQFPGDPDAAKKYYEQKQLLAKNRRK